MSETRKISDCSVLQILGGARARLPQDTHLTCRFLNEWRLCALQHFLQAVTLLGGYVFIDLGGKLKALPLISQWGLMK